ncbi:MAG TPA: preprotein translocase subunit SecE, partial [Gammaproteobacteria bacterium]|nr:preprotein translocase subunit SecE [Gammaproteobacteria bacterium]
MSKSVESQVKKESSIVMMVSILIVLGSFVLYYQDPLGLNTTLYKVLVLL